MRHLDFTIDFETVGLTANAAPMMVAVVPWFRDAKVDPLMYNVSCVIDEEGTRTMEQNINWVEPYIGYVDLRTCVVDGFDFDPKTVQWWAERSESAKQAVTKGQVKPVQDVLVGALEYIRDMVQSLRLESICLWCQGMDVDIAILRNICYKYDIELEDDVPHTQFRDSRTIILEGAMVQAMQMHKKATEKYPELAGGSPRILREPDMAYKVFDPLPSCYAAGSEAHDALYDAMRSSWYTWQALKSLRP